MIRGRLPCVVMMPNVVAADLRSRRAENDPVKGVQKFSANLEFLFAFVKVDVFDDGQINVFIIVAANVVIRSRGACRIQKARRSARKMPPN